MKNKALIIAILCCASFSSASYASFNPFSSSDWNDVGNDIKGGFEKGFSKDTWNKVGNFFTNTLQLKQVKVGLKDYVYDKGLKVAGEFVVNALKGGWQKIKEVPGQLNGIADVISGLPASLNDSVKPIDAIPTQLADGYNSVVDSISQIIKTELDTESQRTEIKKQLNNLPFQLTEFEELEAILMSAFDELGQALKTLANPADMAQCSAVAKTTPAKAFALVKDGGPATPCACGTMHGSLCEMQNALALAKANTIDGNKKIHGAIANINSKINQQACIGKLCYPSLPERLRDIANTINKVLP